MISWSGTNWGPVTNTYTLTAITNNRPYTQTFFRVDQSAGHPLHRRRTG